MESYINSLLCWTWLDQAECAHQNIHAGQRDANICIVASVILIFSYIWYDKRKYLNRSPMNLPVPDAKAVADFKQLYLEKFGIDLPDDEAYDLALRFLQFFYFGITPPPTKDDTLNPPAVDYGEGKHGKAPTKKRHKS